MVENKDFPFSKGLTSDGVIGLASPKDRLASYVVDALLLLPLVQLLQSPFKRWILESFIFGEEGSVVWFRLINMVIFILAFITYYTVMTYFGGQTLGKKFFQIKVISYQGKISLMTSFLRSFSIFLEMLCIGVPFLAIFSHVLRRPIHDRVADTLVISLKSPVGFPGKSEKWRAHALAVGMGAFAILTFVAYAFYFISMADDYDPVAQYNKSCSQEMSTTDESLQSGIELFMTQKISNECLFKHAREFLWKDDQADVAHLAIALSFVDDKRMSEKYLNEVCNVDKQGTACLFSEWVMKGFPADRNEAFVTEVFSNSGVDDFYKVYLASILIDKGFYSDVEQVVKSVSSENHLQSYISVLSFNSLLSQYRWEEAYWIFQTSQHIKHPQVVNFLKEKREEKTLTVIQQKQMLEKFYPKLLEDSSKGRGLASKKDIPESILALHKKIEEEL